MDNCNNNRLGFVILKYNKNNEQLDMFFLTMSKDQALEKKYDQKPIRYTI